ncbi:hypothetical protein M0811_01687 [Anaeramoeba ignava]|uniref:Uncharacterized protein n=1 Tax=Anaeramoeba ignava TaxID=1746090 RepID=A0A9Q0R832_ANAIG|nr:hypothetical protein M0811_01687 [Anaeramoeba ignava]
MKKTKINSLVKNYADGLTISCGILACFIFAFVFFQSIFFPGKVYCNDYSCPNKLNPKVNRILVIVISCIFDVFVILIGIPILNSPGHALKNAKRTKGVFILIFGLIPFSFFQSIFPEIEKGYVATYYSAHNYSVEITLKTGSSAEVNFTNIFSEYTSSMTGMVVVYEATGDEVGIYDLSPVAHQVYRDKKKDSSFEITSSVTSISREISNLEDSKYYMWTIIPAKIISDKTYPADRPWTSTKYSINFASGYNVSDAFVDRRIYRLCKWSSYNGCEYSTHS